MKMILEAAIPLHTLNKVEDMIGGNGPMVSHVAVVGQNQNGNVLRYFWEFPLNVIERPEKKTQAIFSKS